MPRGGRSIPLPPASSASTPGRYGHGVINGRPTARSSSARRPDNRSGSASKSSMAIRQIQRCDLSLKPWRNAPSHRPRSRCGGLGHREGARCTAGRCTDDQSERSRPCRRIVRQFHDGVDAPPRLTVERSRGGRAIDVELPLIQFVERAGVIDLAWGHPDPALLPVADIRSAASVALDEYGSDALEYGNAAGPEPLISMLCERLSRIEGRRPRNDELLVTTGNSAALDQVTRLMTKPGDVVLIESPTYHLAAHIFRDHPVALVDVPWDEDGPSIGWLHRLLPRLRKAGRIARMLYTVPTFHNPTGRSVSLDRRLELVSLAAAEGFVIVEDDPYRELSYEGTLPPTMWSLGEPGRVVRLGSFSKTLAPGLRVGYLTADADTVQRFVQGGVLDSGGGANHFASLVVSTYARKGRYAEHVHRLCSAYRERRDALIAALSDHMPPGTTWTRPSGGYFVWLTLASGVDATELLPKSESVGMSFVPGPAFFGGHSKGFRCLRLSFSRYPPALLREAVARLGRSLKMMA